LWYSLGAFADTLWLQPKRWEDEMFQDLRYGIRMMFKHKTSTLIAIVMLAFGIGGNTTIFSVLESVLFHPFALPHQDRLVMINESVVAGGVGRTGVTPGTLQDWREQSRLFEQFATANGESYELRGGEQPEQVNGYSVSANYFAALGVRPLLGRTFQPGEDMAGREQVVVLKYSFWQRRFGADPNTIGQTITLGSKGYTVIGVMPADFNFPNDTGELWTPYVFPIERRHDRETHMYNVIALLKPGVTPEQGSAELRGFARRAKALYPAAYEGVGILIGDLDSTYTRGVQKYLPFLLIAVLFVLLIACANVAGLLMVRGAARQKELAVRQALGASQARIIRQLLTESVLLALLSGGLGLWLAHFGVTAIKQSLPQDASRSVPGWENMGLNTWALGFTLLISLLTGVLFGLMPALHATRASFTETLKESGKGIVGMVSDRLRDRLVVAQIALSLVLLVGAGLVLQSFVKLLNTDLGFKPDNVISASIVLPNERYPMAEQRISFYQELERRLAVSSDVAGVGLSGNLPGGWSVSPRLPIQIVGQPSVPTRSRPTVPAALATPGYFAAAGIPLRAGRMFSAQDDGKVPVALVNEAFARRFFPNGSALGERLHVDDQPPMEIVGIVGTVLDSRGNEPEQPGLYQPLTQHPRNALVLIVRGRSNPSGQENFTNLVSTIRKELADIDPNLPLSDTKPLRETIRERVAPRRIITWLLGIFGLQALLMATVGLYAVLSFTVAQRSHEIGIRLALGAQVRDVYALVVKQGMRLVRIGVALGLVGAFVMARVLSRILFGITATDPLTFLLVAIVLTATAFIACWVPARRAAKVDPLVSLRHE
jgi:putative ABC transport system permease protein